MSGLSLTLARPSATSLLFYIRTTLLRAPNDVLPSLGLLVQNFLAAMLAVIDLPR
jgi:hypothetical protein